MTSYSAVFAYTVSGTTYTYLRTLALRAGSYAIKINRIELLGVGVNSSTGSYGSSTSFVNHYVSSTISGGTLLTPQPMREGASAASATVRYSTGTSSGTTFTPGTAVGATGSPLTLGYINMGNGVQGVYQTPSDLLIAPGSVLYLAADDVTSSGITAYTAVSEIAVYFEEYHLARST